MEHEKPDRPGLRERVERSIIRLLTYLDDGIGIVEEEE